ncbi:MAG TPA: MmcQ/YjbR family DNA-binding protein [Flavobacteriales bacterium]|nr:MmcQ/YjbR family DNA-binding protein [Flavobacteriales bacterium]
MDTRIVRAMALDMPGTAAKENFGRPVFSVKKKTYLTVWAEEQRVVLKLTPAQQAQYCADAPDHFRPVRTKLGKYGWTEVQLDSISERTVRYVIDLAWRNVAPKWLIPTRQPPPK